MATARTRASHKYNIKTYEKIEVRVLKGRKQDIVDAAKAEGMSTSAYIVASIEEKMTRGKVLRDGG